MTGTVIKSHSFAIRAGTLLCPPTLSPRITSPLPVHPICSTVSVCFTAVLPTHPTTLFRRRHHRYGNISPNIQLFSVNHCIWLQPWAKLITILTAEILAAHTLNCSHARVWERSQTWSKSKQALYPAAQGHNISVCVLLGWEGWPPWTTLPLPSQRWSMAHWERGSILMDFKNKGIFINTLYLFKITLEESYNECLYFQWRIYSLIVRSGLQDNNHMFKLSLPNYTQINNSLPRGKMSPTMYHSYSS